MKKNEISNLAQKITDMNGIELSIGNFDIPLSLHIGITKIPEKGLSYSEFIGELETAIDEARNCNTYYNIGE